MSKQRYLVVYKHRTGTGMESYGAMWTLSDSAEEAAKDAKSEGRILVIKEQDIETFYLQRRYEVVRG